VRLSIRFRNLSLSHPISDGVYGTEERFASRDELLRLIAINYAKLTGEADLKGSIEPGKLADFGVLSDDLLTVDANKIPTMKAMLTYVGGQEVWRDRRWRGRDAGPPPSHLTCQRDRGTPSATVQVRSVSVRAESFSHSVVSSTRPTVYAYRPWDQSCYASAPAQKHASSAARASGHSAFQRRHVSKPITYAAVHWR
jgi:Amidohydrolase family